MLHLIKVKKQISSSLSNVILYKYINISDVFVSKTTCIDAQCVHPWYQSAIIHPYTCTCTHI